MLAWVLSVSVLAGESEANDRVALVIGNGSYAHAPSLVNPVKDARLIAQSLRSIGFEVTEKEDLAVAPMQTTILDFGNAAKDANVALVYYAGHGMQINEKNYLIPVDANPRTESAVVFQAISLEAFSGAIASARTRVVILDACRDDPFAKQMSYMNASRGAVRGLARIEATAPGELIVFSTAPGRTAEDGTGANSTFATALATYIRQPGLEIHQVFTRVGLMVSNATNADQVPWQNSSLVGDVFLNGSSESAKNASPEILLWQSAQNAGTTEAYQAYKRRYPQGQFAEMADIQLSSLAHPKPTIPGMPMDPGLMRTAPPTETAIHTVLVAGNRVLVGVMYPPSGPAAFAINGKDVTGALDAEQAHSVNTIYTFAGSATTLNLRVGQNVVTGRIADKSLPDHEFTITQAQMDRMNESAGLGTAKITMLNVVGSSVVVTVANASSQRPHILFNGRDISQFLVNEYKGSAGPQRIVITYAINAAPQSLNLHVGSNLASVSYPDKKTEDFEFFVTQAQYSQGQMERRR